MLPDFVPFRKIPRLSREIIITEKIDGTNGVIHVSEDGVVTAGSRTRWISPESDNHGFAIWAHFNSNMLKELGPGVHYGEWWGNGIQRGYGLAYKQFSLFNVSRWLDNRPACCNIVPVLYQGPFDMDAINYELEHLKENGSVAAPGFMKPEGVIIYHTHGNTFFKKTIEKDHEWKGK